MDMLRTVRGLVWNAEPPRYEDQCAPRKGKGKKKQEGQDPGEDADDVLQGMETHCAREAQKSAKAGRGGDGGGSRADSMVHAVQMFS